MEHSKCQRIIFYYYFSPLYASVDFQRQGSDYPGTAQDPRNFASLCQWCVGPWCPRSHRAPQTLPRRCECAPSSSPSLCALACARAHSPQTGSFCPRRRAWRRDWCLHGCLGPWRDVFRRFSRLEHTRLISEQNPRTHSATKSSSMLVIKLSCTTSSYASLQISISITSSLIHSSNISWPCFSWR